MIKVGHYLDGQIIKPGTDTRNGFIVFGLMPRDDLQRKTGGLERLDVTRDKDFGGMVVANLNDAKRPR